MTIMPSHRGSEPKRRVPTLCSSSLGFVSAMSLSLAAFSSIAQGQTVGSRDADRGAAASNAKAVVQANRTFADPEMMKPTIDEKVFTFVDVGAKIPNYTPGRQWGNARSPLLGDANTLASRNIDQSLFGSSELSHVPLGKRDE